MNHCQDMNTKGSMKNNLYYNIGTKKSERT